MVSEPTRLWLALSMLPGVGRSRLGRLRKHCADPRQLLDEPPGLLASLGLPGDVRERLPWDAAEGEIELAARAGVQILSPQDEAFPRALAALNDGPSLLCLQGEMLTRDEPAVAIVGTRRATAAGLETARRLASELAEAGVTVVSGLARGIDTAAHRGALEPGGRTLAVLGGGLLRPYPPENRELLASVAASGVCLTEYAMQAEPFLGAFLRRNRWIAALSAATVIVEAPRESGALKTARHAVELGRALLVAPGPLYTESWAGSLALLRDGAELVTQVGDILARIGVTPDAAGARRSPQPVELWPDAARRVLDCLEALPMSIEQILERSGLEAAEVRSALVALELSGAVRRHPGPLYGLP